MLASKMVGLNVKKSLEVSRVVGLKVRWMDGKIL